MPTKKKDPKHFLPRSGGPPKKIDWEVVEKLCFCQCSQAQVAQALGVGISTLVDAIKREFDCTWEEYFDYYRQGGLNSLRLAQFNTAIDGNATMQIWLGKQHLDQKDRNEVGFDPERPATFVMNMGKKLAKQPGEKDNAEN